MAEIAFPMLVSGEQLAADETLPGGPSNKYHPYTFAEARDRLSDRVDELSRSVAAIPEERRGDRVIIEATLLPNYLASSYQPTQLLTNVGLVPVGSRISSAEYITKQGNRDAVAPTKTLQLAAGPDSLPRLRHLLDDASPSRATEALQDQVRRLADIALPDTRRIVLPAAEDDTVVDLEVVLHRSLNRSGSLDRDSEDRVLRRLVAFLASDDGGGGEVDEPWVRRSGGIMYVPVRMQARSAGALAAFNAVRSAHPFPQLEVPVAPSLSVGDALLSPGLAPRSDQAIAVFDLGVDASHPYFSGLVEQIDLTDEPPETDGVAHGTLVTSAIMFGALPAGIPPKAPNCPVHMYRIGPPPASAAERGVYWALDRVKEVLGRGEYRLAAITTGPTRCLGVYGEAPSSWTADLDEIAKDNDVLIVTSAGNTGTVDPRPTDSSDRVQVPADAVNGLSVGAALGQAGEWERASYSSRGPGRAGLRVQPLVMAFGGDDTFAFGGAAPGGDLAGDFGTSFSGSLVAGQLAVLGAALDDQGHPETLRAFAVHFGDLHRSHVPDDHGHGLVSEDLSASVDGGPDEITVLYQPQLIRGQAISLPVPVPADQPGNVEIRWTISYLSTVDRANWPDYTNSGLDVTWRPNANRFTMSPPSGVAGTPRKIDLDKPEDVAFYTAQLAAGWRTSNPTTKARSGVRTEQVLRDEGKWETVIHDRITHRASNLHLPGLWVNYLYRTDGVLQDASSAPPLDVSILVTVVGRNGSGVYRQATAYAPFSRLPALTTSIEVHQRA